ncbi:MAG: alpha/beta hydrolase [Kibdelosporangium sp.]
MPNAKLHDGSIIEVQVHGEGPTVLLPVNPEPVTGEQAEAMRQWGADPALGQSLINGLSDAFQVVAFDYEGHVLANPKPDSLTPANIAADLLAIADVAGPEHREGPEGTGRFVYYGYSWLALSGLQLALRTDRLSGLVMGGFPPVDGPYREMLAVTAATHAMSGTPKPGGTSQPGDWSTVEVTMPEARARQFMTLYQALQGFDDRAAQPGISCPRLCLVGSADEIEYGEKWGGVHVSMAGPIITGRADLEALGWQVHVMDGLDHTGAMQAANVLPVLRPWLESIG